MRKRKRFVPKKYQKRSIEFGVTRPAAGFFLAPGLGKTTVALAIFKILKKLGFVDELLVIAKKKLMTRSWPKELRKWKGFNFPFAIVHGPHKHTRLMDDDTPVKLLNFDAIAWLAGQKDWIKKAKTKRIMLVIDESSKIKNHTTVRFRKLKKLLPLFARRYIMTGSPAAKGLMGLFSQIYVLDLGEALGTFITQFRNEYFYPSGYMGYDWKLQKGAKKRMFKDISHLVIRFGDDELDLPPLTFIDRKIELPAKVRTAYDEIDKELMFEFKSGSIIAANMAVATGKLRQMANGGVIYSETNKKQKWRWLHDAKCEELLDLVEELNGEPALVAVEYHHDVERIRAFFKKRAPQYGEIPYVTGKTKDKDVDDILDKWDRGELPILLGNPTTIAHGLNLQGKGGIVVFFSLPWSFEDYDQFFRRIWRQGQKRRVLVYRIIARNTVDERVIEVLEGHDHTQKSLFRAMERYYGIRKQGRQVSTNHTEGTQAHRKAR